MGTLRIMENYGDTIPNSKISAHVKNRGIRLLF